MFSSGTSFEDLLGGNFCDKVSDMVQTSLEESIRLTLSVERRVSPISGITVVANSTNAVGLG